METSAVAGVRALLHPVSIAVVGASEKKSALGERVVRYLQKHGYRGKIFPINPQYQEVMGLPCFGSLVDVPEPIDLAVITLSADQVPPVLEDCVRKRVGAATIFAAGYAESGPEGKARQAQIREIAGKSGLRVCGPNCLGTINVKDGIAASFGNAAEVEKFIPGNVGVVAQSGGLAGSLFDRAQEKGLGVSYLVSSGNEADLEVADYCSFMLDDPDTKVIMMFIEGLKDGPKFIRMAEKALKARKPLVVLKAGSSERGGRAAATHTGSLAGSDRVYDGIFRQKGVIRVDDIDELVDTAALFARHQQVGGARVGVMAPSGGAGVIISDKCEKYGLQLPAPSSRAVEELTQLVPSFGTISNPLDPTGQGYGDMRRRKACMEAFISDENFDLGLIQMPTVAGTFGLEFAQAVVGTAALVNKPVAALCTGGGLSRPAIEVFKDNGIPFFLSFDSCFKAIASLAGYSRSLERTGERLGLLAPGPAGPEAQKLLAGFSKDGGVALTEFDSKRLLSHYSIPCTREGLAKTPDDAVTIARRIGYPVAMKIQSPQILHKTEARGIKLGIEGDGQVRSSFAELVGNARTWDPQAQIDGILVQEMVPEGVETIAGISHDPQFGPVVLFGLGGIFVEVLNDVSVRAAPLTRIDAEDMVRGIKGFPVLQGTRGRPRGDVGALVDVLLRLSQLATDSQGLVSQVDINPLVVLKEGQGVKAVDSLVVLQKDQAVS